MDVTPLIEVLQRVVPEASFEPAPPTDQPTLIVGRDHLVAACAALRSSPELQFGFLSDVTAVDWWPREPRFEVVYHLASIGGPPASGSAVAPGRLRLKVRVAGDAARVPTVSGIWPAANWAEREVWDLFGIEFEGHPDLRRILMPDEWEGHPLRKDYPVQIHMPPVIHEPLQLTEEEFAQNIVASRHAVGAPVGERVPGSPAAPRAPATRPPDRQDGS